MIRRSRSIHLSVLALVFLLLGAGLSDAIAAEEPSMLDIAALDWLAGCWSGEGGEECWLRAEGGLMVGVNRSPGGGMFEFLRIEQESDAALVYYASPKAQCPATAFKATEVDVGRVVFENPNHDFPQRIEYWLDDADHLHARISAEPAGGGESRGFEMTWQRSGWSGPQS